MRGCMDPRDRRDVALYRRGLLARLHLGTDKRAHGVRIRRQKGLAHRFAVRLEDRPVRFLGAQRVGRVSALRHRLPFEQVRQRAVEHRLRGDRHGPEFRAPLGHFHFIHRIIEGNQKRFRHDNCNYRSLTISIETIDLIEKFPLASEAHFEMRST